jgi:hypothetical protein
LKNNLTYNNVDILIKHYFDNLTKEINKLQHYNIYVQNLGQLVLSPSKLKAAKKYAIKDEREDRVQILDTLLLKANTRIQENIQKKHTKIEKRKGIKINFKEYVPEK